MAASAALLALAFFNLYGSGDIFMNGGLSSKHALLSHECGKCHVPWKGPVNASCATCHKNKIHRVVKRGCVICHAAPQPPKHAVVRVACSNCHVTSSFLVASTSTAAEAEKKDPPKPKPGNPHVEDARCSSCHREHGGIDKNLKNIDSAKCRRCHTKDHPANAVIPVKNRKWPTLKFPHGVHLADEKFKSFACVDCHARSPDGEGFETTVKFKESCEVCHLVEQHDIKAKDKIGCPSCHINPEYKVAWMGKQPRKFVFSSKKHINEKCLDCHKFYPKNGEPPPPGEGYYKRCADCHAKKLVNSDCATCHPYHAPPA